MNVVIALIALIGGLALLDRALLAAEERGWIYYRKRRASPGTASGAALEMQSLLEPGTRHVADVLREQIPRSDEREE